MIFILPFKEKLATIFKLCVGRGLLTEKQRLFFRRSSTADFFTGCIVRRHSFLCSSAVVALEVFLWCENTGWFHGTAHFWAEEAFHAEPSLHREGPAIVADPVIVGDNIDAVATLVDRNVAVATKYNQILILVVAIVTDCTLGVFLDSKASLLGTHLVVARIVSQVSLTTLLGLVEPLKLLIIINFILLLLPELYVAQEFFLLHWRIVHIQKNLILVL